MLFKYVLVGLLGVGALGAVYVAKTGGCSAPAAADTAPSTTIGAEDCGACPVQGATDVASDALAIDAEASQPCFSESAEACPMGGSAGVECVEMDDCGEACGDCDEPCGDRAEACEKACDTPCDTPCDAGPQKPAEKSASE